MKTLSLSNFTLDEFLKTDREVEGAEGMRSVHGGKYLPFSLLARDMQAGVASQGGALVTQAVDQTVVPFLRAKSVCGRLGADMRVGLRPPTSLPVVLGDFNAQWLGENQECEAGDLRFGNALLSPHRISISITASKLLSAQSAPDFDQMISSQATAKLMQALDQAALTGSGGVQPIGILKTNGIATVTFGGPVTWPNFLKFEQTLGNANADGASMGFAQSWDTRARWKQVQRETGTSTYIQDDDNRAGGFTTAATTELNSTNAGDKVIFANWSDLVIGTFGNGVWVQKNPYLLAKSGEDQWSMHLYCDCGVKRTASFVVSIDSAAQ
jgi:hypothetical protein